MKQPITGLCFITLFSIACLGTLQGEIAEETMLTKCSKEELMTFFPQEVVKSVLLKEQVSADQANEIAKELSQKDRELTKLIEEKAAKLDPNPFKDLSQRDTAIKIYRETLYEVFAKVLKANGIKNEDKIQSLLEEMQAAKSKLFIECIRKQTSGTQSAK